MRKTQLIIRFLVIFIAALMLMGCSQPISTPNISSATPQDNKPTQIATIQAFQPGPKISQIQGSALRSPFEGQYVENVHGVVTTFRGDGFYFQDPSPDNDEATSEGLFVFTRGVPKVKAGDEILVSGVVEEFYPGGLDAGNQPITNITDSTVEILLSGVALPPPTIIGTGGRIPPGEIIDDDGGKEFNPQADGLDFYESLESMLVKINNPLVVGASNAYKEITIVADGGTGVGLLNPRGGIVLQPQDFNPERMILDDSLRPLPMANVGDGFADSVIGVVDYSFGNYKIQVIQKVKIVSASLERETAPIVEEGQFSVATFNLENLDARDDDSRFAEIAQQMITSLRSPDILVLEEIQDNNGSLDDGTVDANLTYTKLVEAILDRGGPQYQFVDIPPEDNQDGGEPGGNIRVGFLYRTDRGLSFSGYGNPLSDSDVVLLPNQPGKMLSSNPGRFEVRSTAFNNSRKPLVGHFLFRGVDLFVIGLHLNSKGEDTLLYGVRQPPFLGSEGQRKQQTLLVRDFVDEILAISPSANIIVAGDLNDFQFSKAVENLIAGEGLVNLVGNLPVEEQYTYVFDGNSQVLDQILVSPALAEFEVWTDIVHINAEFAYSDRTSDHDPVLAVFQFR